MATPTPDVFADFDVLDGFEPVDKAALVGVPFGVTGVRFRKNDREVVFAELEIVQQDGEKAALQDSSTGVRDQATKYLLSKGVFKSTPALDEWYDVKLFAPRGLRVSTYEVHDAAGKAKQAKTYYLTTVNQRR